MTEDINKFLFIFFFVVVFLCMVNTFWNKINAVRETVIEENNIDDNIINQVPPKYEDINNYPSPPPY